jgi:type IX secretion system PorP/SprF family membrane protein
MKRSLTIFLALQLSFSFSVSKGQDLHFSQVQMTPLHLNAAEAGGFVGNARAFANYKSQWQSVGSGYRTFDLAFDTHLFGQEWDNSTLGAGAIVYRDVSGALNFGTTEARAMIAYHTLLGENSKISAGIGGGYVQQSVDKEQMRWGGQYDGTGYDPGIAVQAEQGIGNSSYIDLNSGIRFTAFSSPMAGVKNEGWRIDAGVSGHHLHEPQQEFLTNSASGTRVIPRKYLAYVDGHYGIENFPVALHPTVLMSSQGPSQELLAGLMFRYMLKEGSIHTGLVEGAAVSLGAHYRAGDALVPALMLEFGSYKVGVSYDVNMNPLSRSTNGQGGIEISFRFQNPNPFQSVDKSGMAKFL